MSETRTPAEIAGHKLIDLIAEHVKGSADAADTLRQAADELEDALVRQEAARIDTPKIAEVTGNITEAELAARLMEEKAVGARAIAAKEPRLGEAYEIVAQTFTAAASDLRAGLHLPELVIEGRVIPYNEDNDTGIKHADAINTLCGDIHARNVKAGWWHDLETGEPKDRNVGELLCLVHSEISEAMEGHRKSLPDDKLPHRPMFEVELADAVIRIADMAGGVKLIFNGQPYTLDLGGAIDEKLAFNAVREDHQLASRLAENGKKY